MKRQAFAATAVAVAATAVLPAAVGAAPVKPAPAPTPTIEAKSLVKTTKALKRTTPKRGQLLTLAERARRQQKAGQYCASLKTAKQYRSTVKRAPKKSRKRLLAGDAAALSLSQQLLMSSKAKACGGGIGKATVAAATPQISRSDATGLDLTVALPDVSVGSTERGGKLWTALGAPNAEAAGKPGEPAIPTASFSVAVPEGATVETTATAGDSYVVTGVDVLPVQNEAVDNDTKKPNFFKGAFLDPKFVAPGDSYKRSYPAQPAETEDAGSARGLKIATLQVPLAEYDGKRKRLTIRRSVNVKVDFKGGTSFGGEIGPWDRFGTSLAESVVNNTALIEQLKKKIRIPERCGEEFTIITHPSMRASADKLAVARNAGGIKTRVFETVAGQAGTTKEQIRDFIRARATHPVCVRPGYVLLLGNDEFVPKFELTYGTSDLPYATTNDADSLPDLAQARIPGSAAEVDIAVDKIIAYAGASLGTAANRALVAAQFQDDNGDGREDRTFIQFAETVSKGLEARGNSVSRVYGEEPHGTPTKFNDGTNLPASLKKPTFAWDGDAADITSAWNAGTFLAIHRDHGWTDGWGTPYFTTSNVEALSNTVLPVLMSINCSSGAYDRDDTSFATRALGRSGGGAVAVFGDTEDSPSTHNSIQGLGFVDALLPSVLPGEGPASKQRLGDALVHGKLRLNSLKPASGDNNTIKEHQIWQLFGDPTMRMKGGGGKLTLDPSIFNIVLVREFQIGPPPVEGNPGYSVEVGGLAGLEGQVISLRKGTEVVGQGVVEGGKASVKALFGDGSVKPGDLTVVIDAPTDEQPLVLPVPTSKAPTELAQTCPKSTQWGSELTVNGQLSGAPAGTKVKVNFTFEKGLQGVPPTPAKSIEVIAETDGDGKYTATYKTIRQDQGQWSVKSSYEGDDARAASTSDACAVTVSSVAVG